MVSYRLITVAGLVATVYALPLNINLGAYSPALVVGDGEISFGGGQDVSNLMNALEGAAVNAAGTAAGRTATGATTGITTGGQTGTGTGAVAVSPAPTTATAAVGAAEVSNSGVVEPVTPATQPDASLQEQAAAITTLQGMGKEIAPREGEAPKAKRDLAGFDRALQFAENALTKGPVIQLGTGEGGAGVGIIVDNRPTGTAAGGRAGKRDEDAVSQPRRRTKVTTMYVRRGAPAGDLQASTELDTRDIKSLPVAAALIAKDKRDDSSSTIDSINLNVNDPQGVTFTFVETVDDEE